MALETLLQELEGIQGEEKEQVTNLVLDLITDTDTRDKIFNFHQHTKGMDPLKRTELIDHINELALDSYAQDKLTQLHKFTKSLDSQIKNRLYLQFFALIKDPTLDAMLWDLLGIIDDPKDTQLTRVEVLSRIGRYIKVSRKGHRKNKNNDFKPEVTSRMMVTVNFTGVGGEHNDDHFGIVWAADPKRDNVLIIPTTSLKEDKKFYNHYFSIGKVQFLEKETVVMLDQTVAVSHKRIEKETFIDPATKTNTPVYISKEQEWHIRDGIRVSYLGYQTLFHFLHTNFRSYIPEMVNEPLQHTHLLRPFNLISNDPEKMLYTLIDDPETVYTIKWRVSAVSKNQRDRLLSKWFQALGAYNRDPKTNERLSIRLPRRTSAANAYTSLLGATLP
ncbi:hypothetical protein [Brevibacillus choshinensis]|uniref:hypothetical protein n=1 Tax=Brevibacillus choshinensis TaxID=54911 RepID=UPI002E1AFFEA|nr:hypothetical protein [Brevibacillus choshinensis]